MFQEVLKVVLHSLDLQAGLLFDYEDVADWPVGAVGSLLALGVLREGGHARFATCDGCGENCLEEVEFIDGGDDETPRAYLICHQPMDIGRVPVPADRLMTWSIETSSLAEALAHDLGAAQVPEESVPGRLWWLGRTVVQDAFVDAFLARGAAWNDAVETFGAAGRLQECSRPIVMVPWSVPTDGPLVSGARVLSLARALSISDYELHLDLSMIAEVMGEMAAAAKLPVVPRLVIEGSAVEYEGSKLILSELPLKLLTRLAAAGGNLVSRDELVGALWGQNGLVYMEEIRRHAKAINDACLPLLIGGTPRTKRLVQSKKGAGYFLNLLRDEIVVK